MAIVTKPIILPVSALGLPPFVHPVMPPYPSESLTDRYGEQVVPLGFKLRGERYFWYLPQEPTISVTFKNNIVRRSVAKYNGADSTVRGTVKERWSKDDYQINITGFLRNWDSENDYPKAHVQELRRFCEAGSVQVVCPLFEILNINQIAIDDYSLPHTKGENLQAYTITAHSDMQFELLIGLK